MSTPEIIVEKDYDGYFECLVRGWCQTKLTPFKSKKIVISARPFKPHAVTANRDKDDATLYLDFYSPLRTGFGKLSELEVEQIKEEWL